jgi:hypothetical protein
MVDNPKPPKEPLTWRKVALEAVEWTGLICALAILAQCTSDGKIW